MTQECFFPSYKFLHKFPEFLKQVLWRYIPDTPHVQYWYAESEHYILKFPNGTYGFVMARSPMECGLELAEADRDAYKKKVEESAGKYKELAKDHDKAIQACCDADKRIVRLQRALWMTRATALKRLDVDKYIRKHMNSIFWKDGVRTFNEACYSMQVILLVQIRKCLAKAEEYK